MSEDFNFNNTAKSAPRIDFKKIFFNPEEGLSSVRIVDLMKGKKCMSHYTPDKTGQKKFVKCPGAGCPLCTNGHKAQPRYFLKVIDRNTNLVKVWEFGSQIKTLIQEFVDDINVKNKKVADEAGETAKTVGGNEGAVAQAVASAPSQKLEEYNIEIRRREQGANPLYSLTMRERLVGDERFAQTLTSDADSVAKDEIKLESLIKPWDVERIKTQILGLIPNVDTSFVGNSPEPTPTVQVSAPAPAPAPAQAVAQTPTAVAEKPAVDKAQVEKQMAELDDDQEWMKEEPKA